MRRERNRGLTFLEMLFLIGILPIAALLEVHLFLACMNVIRSSPSSQNPLLAVDRMSEVLRRDVWNAASLATPDQKTILLSRADGGMLTWKLQDKNAVRSEGGSTRSWRLPIDLRIQQQQSSIVLSSADKKDDAEQWRFISPILASGSGK